MAEANVTRQLIRRSTGSPLALTGMVGKGGEGIVYLLGDSPGYVVKVFQRELSESEVQKLERMPQLATDALRACAAWPEDLVTDTRGRVCDIIMPQVQGTAIGRVFHPTLRQHDHPTWGYRELVRIARNVALSVAKIHEARHVIGDINERNLLVLNDGTVRWIDCDSFQICDGTVTYPCPVAVSQYVPPELIGTANFREITRTVNHDLFGLAVLIFQLLFMGRHPYAGRYVDATSQLLSVTMSQATQRCLFAYGAPWASIRVLPPPLTLPWDAVPEVLRQTLLAAFRPPSSVSRPTAYDWVTVLETVEKTLKQCPENRRHQFPHTYSTCPWCALETSGFMAFGWDDEAIPPMPLPEDGDNIRQAAEQVLNQVRPYLVTHRPATPAPKKDETVQRRAAPYLRARRRWGWGLTVWIIAGGGALLVQRPLWAEILYVGGLVWFFWRWQRALHPLVAWVTTRCAEIPQELGDLTKEEGELQWRLQEYDRRATKARENLTTALTRFTDTLFQYQRELSALDDTIRTQKLSAFLQRFLIDDAHIEGIGVKRMQTLKAYGIYTAADLLNPWRLRQIPGFGPFYQQRLFEWCQRCAQHFHYSLDDTERRRFQGQLQRQRGQDARQQLAIAQKELATLQQLANDPALYSLAERIKKVRHRIAVIKLEQNELDQLRQRLRRYFPAH